MPVSVERLPFLGPQHAEDASVGEEDCFGGHEIAGPTDAEKPFDCSHRETYDHIDD
jgi:hypothetical protein